MATILPRIAGWMPFGILPDGWKKSRGFENGLTPNDIKAAAGWRWSIDPARPSHAQCEGPRVPDKDTIREFTWRMASTEGPLRVRAVSPWAYRKVGNRDCAISSLSAIKPPARGGQDHGRTHLQNVFRPALGAETSSPVRDNPAPAGGLHPPQRHRYDGKSHPAKILGVACMANETLHLEVGFYQSPGPQGGDTLIRVAR
jgi:hypothetical protein